MDHLMCRTNFPKVNIKLKEGLQELMGDISREVLRSQPRQNEIYKFIADYLEGMVSTRERTIEILETTNMISRILQDSGIKPIRSDEAANVIQMAFNNYIDMVYDSCPTTVAYTFKESEILETLVTECQFDSKELGIAKRVIRKSFKIFLEKYTKSFKRTTTCEHKNYPSVVATFGAIKRLLPGYEEMVEAATVIQAHIRGHLVRKKLDKLKPIREIKRMNPRMACRIIEKMYLQYKRRKQIDRNRQAAIAIQAAFRGYISRKKYPDTRIVNVNIRVDALPYSERSAIDFISPEGAYEVGQKIQEYFGQSRVTKEIQRKYEAAILIQAAFRGFIARRAFKKWQENFKLDQAAVVLQSAFRRKQDCMRGMRKPDQKSLKSIEFRKDDEIDTKSTKTAKSEASTVQRKDAAESEEKKPEELTRGEVKSIKESKVDENKSIREQKSEKKSLKIQDEAEIKVDVDGDEMVETNVEMVDGVVTEAKQVETVIDVTPAGEGMVEVKEVTTVKELGPDGEETTKSVKETTSLKPQDEEIQIEVPAVPDVPEILEVVTVPEVEGPTVEINVPDIIQEAEKKLEGASVSEQKSVKTEKLQGDNDQIVEGKTEVIEANVEMVDGVITEAKQVETVTDVTPAGDGTVDVKEVKTVRELEPEE